MRTWLSEACLGQPSIALVSGELGIGKSRLVDEFLGHARSEDVRIGEGRWHESREMPAYLGLREALWPLISDEAVRVALRASGTHWRELARLGAEYSQVLSVDVQESSGEQFGLWRAVAELLQAAAGHCPVVLYLDDVQWADAGSLGLLGFLGSEVRNLPFMTVMTYRSEDTPPDHPLNVTIADLVRAQVLKTLYLRGLSRVEVGALAAAITSSELPSEAIDRLHRETGGNPLFVGEIVRHLGADAVVSQAGTPIPDELRHVISRRLSTLSENCRAILRFGSVLGRDFDLPVIQVVTGLGREALLDGVSEGLSAAMIDEVTSGRYSYHHPLLRTIVHASMTRAQLIDAHQKAAVALSEYYGENKLHHAREIASHLVASGGLGDPLDTAVFCLEGTRQLRALFAFEEARRLLTAGVRAAERLRADDAQLRPQLLVELGYALTALGEPDEALRTYRAALDDFDHTRNRGGVTDTRRWLAATLARYGRWGEVLEVTGPALAEAEEDRTPAYLGLVGSHTMASIVAGRVKDAEPWVPKLLDLAFDDGTKAVANHVAACWHSYGAGDPSQANDHFFRARESFLRAGQDSTAAGVALDHAFVGHFLGHQDISLEAERAAQQLGERTGRVASIVDLHVLRSVIHTQCGRWEEAQEERDRWHERAPDLGGRTVYGQLAERAESLETFWRRGPQDALQLLRTDYPLRNEPLQAVLAAEAGDTERASALADAIHAVAPKDGRGLFWLPIATAMASALCSLEDPRALEWEAGLKRYEGCIFVWFCADLELARIAAMAARWTEANAYFERACATLEERGLVPLHATALYHYAGMLRRRKRAGDHARAERLLQTAAQRFGDVGADFMRAKVEEELRRRGPGRPRSKGWEGLTAREMSVLGLVAQGKSTREIGQELVVSHRTVSRHLENIYGKLDVNNRTAAVARAVRDGVVESNHRSDDELVG